MKTFHLIFSIFSYLLVRFFFLMLSATPTTPTFPPGTMEFELTAEFIRKSFDHSQESRSPPLSRPGSWCSDAPPSINIMSTLEDSVETSRQVSICSVSTNASEVRLPLPLPAVLKRQRIRNMARERTVPQLASMREDSPLLLVPRPGWQPTQHYTRSHDVDSDVYHHVFEQGHYTVEHVEESVPLGALLFVCGFIVWPCWWVGAFTLTNSAVGKRWRMVNRWMSSISIVLLLGAVGILVWWMRGTYRSFTQ
jgi:hypothetical protein